MTRAYDKLNSLLKELFQFDRKDLDFGIYRIMNHRRKEILRFLDEDLLPQVHQDFSKYRGGDEAQKRDKMDKIERNAATFNADPEQNEEYRQLKAELAGSKDVTALENEVYSNLYTFFRRYYKDGDFLSLHRYKAGVYAIPYEGEEVKLHWANADQYYVKTAENFRNYRFGLTDGGHVTFELVSAATERDNNKATNGKESRFVLREEDPLEDRDGELRVYFEYLPHPDKQTDLNQRTCEAIFDGAPGVWKTRLAEPAPTPSKRGRTLLEKHLDEYTARNTFDYFIHKDLGGFLRRELNFFLKNEVLHLDDLDTENEMLVEQYLSKLKVIKKIGRKIIAFLAQIEDFQKTLFLKKKFVVRSDYCLTLDNVPEDLYGEILVNDRQYEEWQELFAISEIPGNLENGSGEQRSIKWLEANPYLVLDTKFFNEDFKDQLLESIEDLDEKTDGLLINSENFQALNLLTTRYRERIKCIYIDPPFNTGDDGFVYKDNYQHSSWLTLLRSNLEYCKLLLRNSGSFFAHIDDNELGYLLSLTDAVLSRDNKVAVVAFKQSSVSGPKAMNPGLANISSFVLWYAKDKAQWAPHKVYVPTKRDDRYNNFIINHSAHYSDWKLTTLRKALAASVGVLDRQLKAHFGQDLEQQLEKFVLEAPEKVVQPVAVNPKDVNAEAREQLIKSIEDPDTVYRFPREDREDYYFRSGKQLAFYSSKVRENNGKRVTVEPASTIWTDLLSNNIHAEGGVSFDKGKKPTALLRRVVELSTKPGDIVLDSFAGSGTTGHAVINLNREDGGKRKYVLVEMGQYFDSVLKKRIQKVIYSKDWKEGKPTARDSGISHTFKYVALESYEDTLNNLSLRRTDVQENLIESNPALREEYTLSYMLDFETKGSPSLLNLDAFEDPFSYKLDITNGDETRLENVDLVETFNYLLGLNVSRTYPADGFRVVEGTNPKGEGVLVIWRNTREKSNEDLDTFFKARSFGGSETPDRVYVNGDNTLPNLKEEGDGWKVHLIEEEFKRLMFETEGI